MASRRVKLAALLGTFALVASACSTTGGSPAPSGGTADCAGAGTAAAEGAELQIPDIEEGKFNVAMVLIGPHDDGGWSQAHYEGLQYVCENVPDTPRRLCRAGARGRRLGAGVPEPRAQGLRLHHRHVVRLHGPHGDRGRRVPRRDVPAPHRATSPTAPTSATSSAPWRTSSTSPACWPGRAPRWTATRRSATWPPSRSPRRSAWATPSCWAPSRPAPSAPWTSAGSTPGTTRSKETRGRGLAVRRRRPGRLHGCRHAGRRRCRRRRRASGASPTTIPSSCALDACLTAPYWIWGPEYARIAEQVQATARTTRAMSTSTPIPAPWASTASWRARRRSPGIADLPAEDVQLVKDTLAQMLAGEFDRFDVFAGPLNDNQGNELLADGEQLEQSRPRPVPADAAGRRLRDVHELVGGWHQRGPPGLQ